MTNEIYKRYKIIFFEQAINKFLFDCYNQVMRILKISVSSQSLHKDRLQVIL
jgi:hypothetical protein